MTVRLRPASLDDAEPAGVICYEAFKTIAEQHGFPPDLPSAAHATDLIGHLLSRSDIHAVIAERDGRVVGSNFLGEHDPIRGVGNHGRSSRPRKRSWAAAHGGGA